MTVAYSTTVRSNRMTQVLNALDGSTNAGIVAVYTAPRPGTAGGAITSQTKLWQLSLGTTAGTKPSGSVASGVLTINTNGSTGAAAIAGGVAAWARFTDSAGTFVIDMDVGTSGSDINLNSTSISSGQTVFITSGGTITDGSS